MNGRIFEIKHFAVHDGDGVRTTVFFKGCPLRCVWCHNPEGLAASSALAFYAHKCTACGKCASVCSAHETENGIHVFRRDACAACGKCASVCPAEALTLYGKIVTAEELLPELLSDRDFYEASDGGVTLSGGECLLQADFCAELLRLLKKENVNTAVDTCGFLPWENLEKVLPFTDAFLYDVKAADAETHFRATGVRNKTILENLVRLDAAGARIEVRVPFVPEWNGGEMEAIAELLTPLNRLSGVRVLPYHNYAAAKYAALGLTNTLPVRLPEKEELLAAEEIFRRAGLPVLAGG